MTEKQLKKYFRRNEKEVAWLREYVLRNGPKRKDKGKVLKKTAGSLKGKFKSDTVKLQRKIRDE